MDTLRTRGRRAYCLYGLLRDGIKREVPAPGKIQFHKQCKATTVSGVPEKAFCYAYAVGLIITVQQSHFFLGHPMRSRKKEQQAGRVRGATRKNSEAEQYCSSKPLLREKARVHIVKSGSYRYVYVRQDILYST